MIGGEAKVLIIALPGGIDEFLYEFHQAEGEARFEVASRYGIEFLRDGSG